jgi:hypothetical protein
MINYEQALQVVTQAMEIAQGKGAFTLQEAATVFAATQVLVEDFKSKKADEDAKLPDAEVERKPKKA